MARLAAAVIALALGIPAVAGAANKEQQQLMAELRMLQEQQQQLQQMLGGLADTLKLMTTRLDSESEATRKAFADQRLLVSGVGDTARVLREKADDTNVRLSTMTQELQALRQTVASMPAPPATDLPAGATDPATGEPTSSPASPTNAAALPSNVSPTRMYDQAYGDYTVGQFDLAVAGFQAFIRSFPTSPRAAEAQLYIGYSLYNAGKNAEAIAALQKVVSDYPTTSSVAAAYYKLGLTYEALKQPDLARRAFETVIQRHASSAEAVLAQQALERMKRRPPS